MGTQPMDLAALAAVGSLLGALVARIVGGAVHAGDWWWIAAGLPLGVLLADFASGVVHWAGDTIGAPDTPILGPRFIAPFREHHTDPLAITTHDFGTTNGNTAVAVLPVLLALWFGLPSPRDAGLLVATLVTSGCAFGVASNQFHKWAHAPRVPRVVAWLQRVGLVLPPGRHARHHTPPFDRAYCITVGWLSAPLDRLGFFRGLERMIVLVRPALLARPAPVRDRAA
jgi:ubiquitin-conjugating enzyme E2 variant